MHSLFNSISLFLFLYFYIFVLYLLVFSSFFSTYICLISSFSLYLSFSIFLSFFLRVFRSLIQYSLLFLIAYTMFLVCNLFSYFPYLSKFLAQNLFLYFLYLTLSVPLFAFVFSLFSPTVFIVACNWKATTSFPQGKLFPVFVLRKCIFFKHANKILQYRQFYL